jgi:diguanylate cyclase (GGDEF)-like protein
MNLPTQAFPHDGGRSYDSVQALLEGARELHATQPEQALGLIRLALDEASLPERAEAYLLEATIYYQQGNLETALLSANQAKAYYELGDTAGELECVLLLGRLQRELSAFEEASEHFAHALVLARKTGNVETEADALNLQASVCGARGEYPQGLEHLEQALAIVRAEGLVEKQANILNNLGTLYTLLGNYPKALESLTSAYELLHTMKIGSRNLATNLIGLGTLYQEMGNLLEARTFFSRARDTGSQTHDPLVEAAALNNLANLEVRSHQWTAAQTLFERALHIAQMLGMRQYEIDNLDGLGQVYIAQHELHKAAETHEAVLKVAQDIGDRVGELDALLNLGKDYLALELPSLAQRFLEDALALAQTLQRQPSVVEAHELLSTVYERAGDILQSLRHYRAFHEAEKKIFNQENEKRTRQLTVQFDLERSRHEAEEYRLRTELLRQARDEAEAMVRERTLELEEAQLEIVTRLAVAAEYRDDDTGEHTKRVGRNAAAIAHALGWAEGDVQLLFTAARLHDVGKIGISDTILHKPGKLEPEEMAKMRTHTTMGARILSAGNSALLKLAEEISLAHHERWDGKGYPLGLKGEAIPLSARIVAVADVLDALTSERPYKRPWSVVEALAEIKRQAGFQFDPRVAHACLQVFGREESFSPLEASQDWHTTVLSLKTLPTLPPHLHSEESSQSVKERFELLLAERTRELEASRNEAQRVSKQLQELAYTDTLTGLGNRRAFETDLESEVSRALHQGDTMSVLTMDLDMLKALNDTAGHERGDAFLRTFAEAVSQQLREVGRVYRVGGDEFMAILAHTGVPRFEEVRQELQKAIVKVQQSGFVGSSASMGLAALSEVRSPGDLVRLSDQRMYQDKLWKRREDAQGKSQEVRALLETN